uniref:E3 ubiquitin protein ligase DRIP2-like n=1 Tax=Tanacetum cinerariifolium TaxID=118510 RepID=A0A6L2MMB6_TANCI|nr:hypothetical protein [Tanacetum cinerariifolium]
MFPHHLQSLGNNNKNSFGGECRRYYDCPASFINNNDDDLMDESRTIVSTRSNFYKETSESSTSSKDVEVIHKDQDHQEQGWLQLSLGTSSSDHVISRPDLDHHQISFVPRLPVELDLLPPGSASSTSSSSQPHMTRFPDFQFPDFRMTIPTAPSFFVQRGGSAPAAIDSATFNHHHHQHHHQYQNNNYMIRPPMLTLSSPPSYSLGRPFHFNSSDALDVTEPSYPPLRMDLRVMNPPPRPHRSGVWFSLQASLNQTKQPYLPQVPKSYLRIKDGRVTVRLLIKYLATKLNLDSEFEIGITCKGEQLLPLLTLQHVRDNIWSNSTKDVVFSRSSSATVDHLMVLNYGRI